MVGVAEELTLGPASAVSCLGDLGQGLLHVLDLLSQL